MNYAEEELMKEHNREYTKESLLNDLEGKSKDIQELKEGIDWIIEHYREGKLPD